MILEVWLVVVALALITTYVSFSAIKLNFFAPIIAGISWIFSAITLTNIKVYGFIDTGYDAKTFELLTEAWGPEFQIFLGGIGFIMLINVFIQGLDYFSGGRRGE